jgi:hypothetical protein
MLKKMLFALVAIIIPVTLCAQEAQEPSKQPATKLEKFQEKTGEVLIRSYTEVGTIRGLGGVITVDAREFRVASNPKQRVTGIGITVKESGRLERLNTSFVDDDEINSLINGIEYISKITPAVTNLKNFEADYRTKGELRISVYNDSKGEISAVVSCGRIGKTQSFIKLGDLEELKKLILTAKSKL